MDEEDVILDRWEWIDEQEQRTYDLLEKLEEGKVSFIAARFAIHMDFVSARQELADQRERLNPDGLPAFRVATWLPEVIA